MPRSSRGASSVEYALLIVGIVTVLLLWVGPLNDAFTKALNPVCRYVAETDCEIG